MNNTKTSTAKGENQQILFDQGVQKSTSRGSVAPSLVVDNNINPP